MDWPQVPVPGRCLCHAVAGDNEDAIGHPPLGIGPPSAEQPGTWATMDKMPWWWPCGALAQRQRATISITVGSRLLFLVAPSLPRLPPLRCRWICRPFRRLISSKSRHRRRGWLSCWPFAAAVSPACASQNAASNLPHLRAHKVFDDLSGRRDWPLFVASSVAAQF